MDIWEASLTFLFFPILVLVAYAADKNFFFKSPKDLSDKQRQIELGNVQPGECKYKIVPGILVCGVAVYLVLCLLTELTHWRWSVCVV